MAKRTQQDQAMVQVGATLLSSFKTVFQQANQVLTATDKTVKALDTSLNRMEKTSKRMASSSRIMADASNRVTSAMRSQEVSARRQAASLTSVVNAQNQVASSASRAASQQANLARQARQTQQVMNRRVGATAAGVTGGMLGYDAIQAIQSGGNTIREVGMGMQASYNQLSAKLIGDVEDPQQRAALVAELRAFVKQVASQKVIDQSQVASALPELAASGWNASDIRAGLPDLISLMRAGDMSSLQEASDLATDVLTAFNKGPEAMKYFANLAATADTASSASFPELVRAMPFITATAKSMGMGMQQTMALITAAREGGARGTRAGNVPAEFLKSLVTNQQEILQQTGVDTIDRTTGKIRLDIPELAKEIKDALASRYNNAQQTSIAQQLFGDLGMEAFNTFTTDKALQAYAKVMAAKESDANNPSKALTTGTLADQMASERFTEYEKATTRLRNQMTELKEGAWKAIEPTLSWMADKAASILELVNSVFRTTPGRWAAQALGPIVAIGGPAALIMTKIGFAMNLASKAAGFLGFNFARIGAAMRPLLAGGMLRALAFLSPVLVARFGAMFAMGGPIAAVIGAAITGWQIGSWLAEHTEIDEWVADKISSIRGITKELEELKKPIITSSNNTGLLAFAGNSTAAQKQRENAIAQYRKMAEEANRVIADENSSWFGPDEDLVSRKKAEVGLATSSIRELERQIAAVGAKKAVLGDNLSDTAMASYHRTLKSLEDRAAGKQGARTDLSIQEAQAMAENLRKELAAVQLSSSHNTSNITVTAPMTINGATDPEATARIVTQHIEAAFREQAKQEDLAWTNMQEDGVR